MAPRITPIINIGVGEDLTIKEFAEIMKIVADYPAGLSFDFYKLDAPRKLLETSCLHAQGWTAIANLSTDLTQAYTNFLQLPHEP